MLQNKPLIRGEESDQSPTRPLADDPRWQLARRIVASKSFEKSSMLTNFLLYICERELRGKGDKINEREIGVKALGRPANYNPGDDNIVRNYARLLRKRLEEYFRTEGKNEALRVDIPRGRYIPVFYSLDSVQYMQPHSSSASDESLAAQTETMSLAGAPPNPESGAVAGPEPASAPPALPAAETVRSSGRSRNSWLSLASILAVLNLALFGILIYGVGWMRFSGSRPRLAANSADAPVSVLPWSVIFNSQNPIHLVASDPDINEIEILTSSSISVSDYANHSYIPAEKTLSPKVLEICHKLLGGHRTALVDTQVAAKVAALAQSNSRKIDVIGARGLQFSDLKTDDHYIFLGSPRSNPWVAVFDDQLDFRFVIDKAGFESIRNVHPRSGEQLEYVPSGGGGATGQTFAIVALVRNPDQNGQILLLAGANAEGTQSTGKLVTDLSRLSLELRKCGIAPSGPLKHFELLLHVQMMASSASEYDVAACHILP